MRQEEGRLRVLSAAEMTRRNGLFGRKGGDPASLKPSEQAIHSIPLQSVCQRPPSKLFKHTMPARLWCNNK